MCVLPTLVKMVDRVSTESTHILVPVQQVLLEKPVKQVSYIPNTYKRKSFSVIQSETEFIFLAPVRSDAKVARLMVSLCATFSVYYHALPFSVKVVVNPFSASQLSTTNFSLYTTYKI